MEQNNKKRFYIGCDSAATAETKIVFYNAEDLTTFTAYYGETEVALDFLKFEKENSGKDFGYEIYTMNHNFETGRRLGWELAERGTKYYINF